MSDQKANPAKTIGALVILGAMGWWFFGGGWQQATDKTMGDIHNKVAQDAITQYEITKRAGGKIEICVHAGMVAAAWLQAKNEAQYTVWKGTEKADCAAAGMPK